uniref:Uncharacterized protein n=1 Tax=Hildenbrandia rubra TaxID=31481 RepID=A0A1C9CFY2_9FLOR|nr:hypothetical protein Hrub_052 [Hildenbrandia rubra]AOM67296.1 hypothetical protein Hrub_052 [Hildenbrandia rubra]
MQVNNNDDNLLDLDYVIDEAPIGWSSTCLDQTLFYYLEHNYISNHSNESDNSLNDK